MGLLLYLIGAAVCAVVSSVEGQTPTLTISADRPCVGGNLTLNCVQNGAFPAGTSFYVAFHKNQDETSSACSVDTRTPCSSTFPSGTDCGCVSSNGNEKVHEYVISPVSKNEEIPWRCTREAIPSKDTVRSVDIIPDIAEGATIPGGKLSLVQSDSSLMCFGPTSMGDTTLVITRNDTDEVLAEASSTTLIVPLPNITGADNVTFMCSLGGRGARCSSVTPGVLVAAVEEETPTLTISADRSCVGGNLTFTCVQNGTFSILSSNLVGFHKNQDETRTACFVDTRTPCSSTFPSGVDCGCISSNGDEKVHRYIISPVSKNEEILWRCSRLVFGPSDTVRSVDIIPDIAEGATIPGGRLSLVQSGSSLACFGPSSMGDTTLVLSRNDTGEVLRNASSTTLIVPLPDITGADNVTFTCSLGGRGARCGSVTPGVLVVSAATVPPTNAHGEERHDVECTERSMKISIPSYLLPQGNVTLLDPSCPLTLNGTDYVIDVGLSQCGTTIHFTDDHVVFVNTILTKTDTGAVDLTVPVGCQYPRLSNVSIAYMPLTHQARFFETNWGKLDVSMEQYKDDQFSTSFGVAGSVARMSAGQTVYLQIHIHDVSQADLGVMPRICVVSPSPSPLESNVDLIIRNGCPVHEHVRLLPSPGPAYFRFAFTADTFRFDSGLVYVHCETSLCELGPSCPAFCGSQGNVNATSLPSGATAKPTGNTTLSVPFGRRRRSAELPKESGTLLSAGPLLLVDEADAHAVPAGLVATIASIAAAAMVVVVALAVALHRARARNASVERRLTAISVK